MDELVQQGIIANKAGKRDEARKYFIAAIKKNRDNEYAWQFMYNVANDDKERLSCLQQILRINPQNEKAKELLNQLKNIEPYLQASTNVPLKNNIHLPANSLKKCPYCAEEVKDEAVVCKFCGKSIDAESVRINSKEYAEEQARANAKNTSKGCLIIVIITVLTSPLWCKAVLYLIMDLDEAFHIF
jgi:tetratricopeptide (TPR) repeat protein